MFWKIPAVVLFGILLSTSSLATASSSGKSLYDRLGGKAAIIAVVGRFSEIQLADNRISKRYKTTDITKWKGYLVDLICNATGGPCKYTGRAMEKAHARRNISDAEFGWTAEHLIAALNHFKVPAKERDEVVAIFASLKDKVVGQ
jgi:hemoglobin